MKRLVKSGNVLLLAVTLLTGLTAQVLAAPCNGKAYTFKQPDNSVVKAKVFGDEHYQRVESVDGYTLCYDANGWICYAELNDAGTEYVSTGVIYRGTPRQETLKSIKGKVVPKQVKLDRLEVEKKAQKKRLQLNPGAPAPSADSDSNLKTKAMLAPNYASSGSIQGLAILINFPDQKSSISKSEISNMLNQTGYSNYRNNGSVKDFYYNVSGGRVSYTNYVAGFYTAKYSKSYYTDASVSFGVRAEELVKEALQWLNYQGFDFTTLSRDSYNTVRAINVFYAGEVDSAWGEGLWPHQGWMNSYTVDGVDCGRYQMSNIGSSLTIGTTIHENGHMLFDWADLYDYDGDSKGVGSYCTMGYLDDYNPVPPNPYFRWLAGWVGYTRLNSYASGSKISVTAGSLAPYCWESSAGNERFMIENIVRSGRWANMPDQGLLIWHVDSKGSNNYNQMTSSRHFLVSVEQADGYYHLERNSNYGDGNDLFASGGRTSFNSSTTPNSNWWSGYTSGLTISNISAAGSTMTFTLGK